MSKAAKNRNYKNRQKQKDFMISLFIGVFGVLWLMPRFSISLKYNARTEKSPQPGHHVG